MYSILSDKVSLSCFPDSLVLISLLRLKTVFFGDHRVVFLANLTEEVFREQSYQRRDQLETVQSTSDEAEKKRLMALREEDKVRLTLVSFDKTGNTYRGLMRMYQGL